MLLLTARLSRGNVNYFYKHERKWVTLNKSFGVYEFDINSRSGKLVQVVSLVFCLEVWIKLILFSAEGQLMISRECRL